MTTFAIVPIDQIHMLVAPHVEAVLAPMGFECQKPLHWLRSSDAPIRQIFCFRQWKGGAIAPAWGVSLDFVPHLSGGMVKWHRTPKSAQLDLIVDARDKKLDMSYTYGPEQISLRAPDVIRDAVPRADEFWARSRSIHELPSAVEWIKRYLSTGLGFYNYVPHPIAYAFILAKTGNLALAQAELDKYLISSGASDLAREKLEVVLIAASGS